MDRPGVWAGGFRAWNDSGGYLATGAAASAGSDAPGAVAARSASFARTWFPFGVHLIEGFFQTVRSMDTLSRQREALVALGTLAAGLAHEINNPAAATARAVDALAGHLRHAARVARAARRAVAVGRAVRRARRAAPRDRRRRRRAVDPLALADREEALGDWLDDHGVDDGVAHRAAARRGRRRRRRGATRAADVLDGDTLGPGLEWVAGTLSTTGAARRDEGVDRAHLGARRRGEVVLAARPRVGAASSTSPRASRARS